MVKIQFCADQERVRGNYLLATDSVVRRLRGQIFELAERDLKLLDEHQLHYTLVPIPDPSGLDQEVRPSQGSGYHGNSPSSSKRPGTRLNSAVLWVTSVMLCTRAMAAICRSYGPIGVPSVSR